ncbi:MAG: S1/P1 nuclease [Pseudohongiellaceae bacterium]
MMKFTPLCWAVLFVLCSTHASGWDETGHRLTADIAFASLDEQTRQSLDQILRQHPRFQTDFIDAMPVEVRSGPLRQRQSWLLGRAAYWPDVARGLPKAERDRYSRPNWHFIDGDLIGRSTSIQGNVYIDVEPLPERSLFNAESVRQEQRVSHIITALDYNSFIYTSTPGNGAERAIALCWILHLIGDVHQPLHSGALFSASIHRRGDRGGNDTITDLGSLHGRWDSALSATDYAGTLAALLTASERFINENRNDPVGDWSLWLQESREIVTGPNVYTVLMRNGVSAAETAGNRPPAVQLTGQYVATMKDISGRRIIQAGSRMASWLRNNTGA